MALLEIPGEVGRRRAGEARAPFSGPGAGPSTIEVALTPGNADDAVLDIGGEWSVTGVPLTGVEVMLSEAE